MHQKFSTWLFLFANHCLLYSDWMFYNWRHQQPFAWTIFYTIVVFFSIILWLIIVFVLSVTFILESFILILKKKKNRYYRKHGKTKFTWTCLFSTSEVPPSTTIFFSTSLPSLPYSKGIWCQCSRLDWFSALFWTSEYKFSQIVAFTVFSSLHHVLFFIF